MVESSNYLDDFWPQIAVFRASAKLSPSTPYVLKRRSQQLSDDVNTLYEASRKLSQHYLKLDATIWISYRDYYGDETQRMVRVSNAYSFNDNLYVDGFCSLRNQIRTFNMTRCNSVMYKGEEYDSRKIDDFQKALYDGQNFTPTDLAYFCHPKFWGIYRNASVALRLYGLGNGHTADNIFKQIFIFIAESSALGTWKEWASNEKAIAAATLSELVKFNQQVPKMNDAVILNGRFSKAPLRNAISNLS